MIVGIEKRIFFHRILCYRKQKMNERRERTFLKSKFGQCALMGWINLKYAAHIWKALSEKPHQARSQERRADGLRKAA